MNTKFLPFAFALFTLFTGCGIADRSSADIADDTDGFTVEGVYPDTSMMTAKTFFADVAANEAKATDAVQNENDSFCDGNAAPPALLDANHVFTYAFADPVSGLSATAIGPRDTADGAGIRFVSPSDTYSDMWSSKDPEEDSIGHGEDSWPDTVKSAPFGVYYIVNSGAKPLCVHQLNWHGGERLPFPLWAARPTFVVRPGEQVLVAGIEHGVKPGMNRLTVFRDFGPKLEAE